MASLIVREAASDRPDRLRLRAFRMYPDSAGIIRLHARGRKRSLINIHLTPAEADDLARALTRTRT